MNYTEFLSGKRTHFMRMGIEVSDGQINPVLFPFQQDVTAWAIRKGRAAIFADTGLGKTFCQIEWARLLNVDTLIVAPLSVARQTVREAGKIGVTITYCRTQADVQPGINITNYEMTEHFNADRFGAVVLDESSILKALDGKTRQQLTQQFSQTPYRLCCTATPAPNDEVELGNHAEFLGICTAAEMKATFFINANKEHTFVVDGKSYRKKGSNKAGQEWRLKHHAEEPFFRWLSSWAISLTKPSDLGYDDDGFLLPPLNIYPHFVPVEYRPEDQLFFTHLHGIVDRSSMRKHTIEPRLEMLKTLIGTDQDQWIIWVGLNNESWLVKNALTDVVEITGSDSPENKAAAIEAFQDGKYRIMVTKPRIGGFGLNLQNAHKMAFFGLNDSWETWYQCIRREWRYGQTQPVEVHVILSDLETEIYHNVMRKDAMARRLRQGLIEHIRSYEREELSMAEIEPEADQIRTDGGTGWTMLLGDACERLKEIEDNSIDLSVYSPPFADLYTYTNSNRDLGNSRDWPEFFQHYHFIIEQVFRVTKPGRLTCVHTSDIPAMAQRDGYIGAKDFPGEVVRAYEADGWTFVGRAFVQKNPQAQAIRTKSKALLFVQLAKDSADSRPALIDQILLFRKPGENVVPIQPVTNREMDNEKWIEWAHGIWTGIQETDTLQYSVARTNGNDEKHICPLQLGTIERCIKLYSNPGELILSPFAGIGSEVYQAIRFGRRGIGIELKPEYYEVAVRNLQALETQLKSENLFSWAGIAV